MKIISFCNKVIEWSFYALFLLVPLVFVGNTSELFEFNKMWITFVLTIFIALAWFTKATLERKISIQRTPLDIPILLFLLSQIISTIFSLDRHVSWWGYYSRFNGGLLSTSAYIFLYFAFVSNLNVKHVLRMLKIILLGGVVTALWGLPSHFGYDLTCFIFRGSLDTSCWTEAFKPTIRVFSTLGQPAWFAAYLTVLIPLTVAYFLNFLKQKSKYFAFFALLLALLFYLDLIFANTRAGFIAFAIVNIIFWSFVFIKKIFTTKAFLRYFLIFNILLLVCNFFTFFPVGGSLNQFTFSGIKTQFTKESKTPKEEATTPKAKDQQPQNTSQSGITDSGDIRKYVWQGALDAWKSNVLFGTGVETFAFAYYKFRPAGHNLTSEWDYLYNKAHNEYLNYLTTTGLFGLVTYLFFIGLFSFKTGRWLIVTSLRQKEKDKNNSTFAIHHILTIGLFSGWISILITNFFGFSVVIMNLFLFLIPAFVFLLNELLPKKSFELSFGSSVSSDSSHTSLINPYQWTIIAILFFVLCSLFFVLIRYWQADVKYALGANLDRVGSYQDAYPLLLKAVSIKPNEPVYKDELSINTAVLASALAGQKETTNAEQFMNNAVALSNDVVTNSPNNVVYWKNRVRLFYTLAQVNPNQQLTYYQEALKAIEKAHSLAPTDAKIAYNLGVLYGQTGNVQKGIEILQETIKLKPDYRDPYFALGLFYHQLAVDQNNKVVNSALQKKAIETYQYILKNINPNDEEVKKSLQEWGAD